MELWKEVFSSYTKDYSQIGKWVDSISKNPTGSLETARRLTKAHGRNPMLLHVLAPLCALAFIVVLALAAVLAQELPAYNVVLEVETKSDWTTVSIEGFTASSYTIVEGSSAPELRVQAAGGSIQISKRQYDTTRVVVRVEWVLLFTDDAVNITVKKGDVEYTTVRVYVRVGGDLKLAWIFTNSGVVPGSGGSNPRSALLPKSALVGAGAQRILLRKMPVPRLVLAFYYPWYANPQGASMKELHWERVSFNEIGSATDYPLLGPYDSWDLRVVRSHIRMAKAAGVDGFLVSFWGPGTFMDQAFSWILDVAAEEGFNVTIYYESVRELTADQIASELSYVLKKYSSHPAFLRVEGKPVIFVYAVGAYGRTPEFWKSVLRKVENSTGERAIYIADSFDTAYLTVFDGLYTYNPIWIKDHRSAYTEEARLVRSFLSLSEGEALQKLWAATVSPGYDDRKIRQPGGYVPRDGGAYYRKTWEAALASDPDMILICTWNEWHEGTEVEPSREYGFEYLRITREYASRYKDWQPPAGVVPRVAVNASAMGNIIRVAIRNVGGEAVVVTRVAVVNATVGLAREPSDFYVYSLPVNSTSYAAFLPLLNPGEEVTFTAVAKGSRVRVVVESWSASGQRALTETQVSVEGASPSASPPTTPEGGGFSATCILAAVALVLAAILILALRRFTRRS
ncbi:MAG: endo-1,3-alpha-glucanase family glycosylhydrolase [Infirmifilum sp.]